MLHAFSRIFGGGPRAPPPPMPRPTHQPSFGPGSRYQVTLRAYSDAFLGRAVDLSGGDKIILHQNVLDAMMRVVGTGDLPYPTIFRIENRAQDRVSHCGVLEFSAMENSAFLPLWMMHNLLLSDGDEVTLSLTELPKVQFVKFQPEYFKFTQIPDPKLTLEFALRKFTCLTQGDNIILQNAAEEHPLTVTQLTYTGPEDPLNYPPAGCVIDSNVEVDFDPPREAPPEKKFTFLVSGQLVLGQVARNEYEYYRTRLIDSNNALKIEFKATSGDPDLFVSCTTDEPKLTDHTWKSTSQTSNQIETLTILPSDPNFGNFYYIGVFGYNGAGTFELSVNEVDPSSVVEEKKEEAKGNQLGHFSGLNQNNGRKCDNCQQMVPLASYTIHTARCARSNWRCAECGKVMPKSQKDSHVHCPQCHVGLEATELDKHIALTHRKVPCECGEEFEPDLLNLHKTENCPLRLVQCKYCQVRIPANNKAEHEEICGGRSVECDICRELVARRRMDIHLATKHQINPCIDPAGNRRQNPSPNRNNNPRAPGNFSGAGPILPSGPGPVSDEDAMLQAALMESRRAAGIGDFQNDDDALQAVLQASLMEARPAAAQPQASMGGDFLCVLCNRVSFPTESAMMQHLTRCNGA